MVAADATAAAAAAQQATAVAAAAASMNLAAGLPTAAWAPYAAAQAMDPGDIQHSVAPYFRVTGCVYNAKPGT